MPMENGELVIRIPTMKNKILYRLLLVLSFIAFIFFFGQIHPLVPFDTDDWMNMSIERPLHPSLNWWNPTKVFPENLEPAVAMLAASFIASIIGDYINALILTNALVVSFFITCYLYFVQKLLNDKFRLSPLSNFCIMALFVLLHFLLLKTKETDNDYLLYAEDCNCYYHYIIPNLLCSCLVLWLMRHESFDWKNYIQTTIIILITYLALCSNLYSTVILIAYIGAKLLYDLFKCNKKERRWMVIFIKQYAYGIIVIFLWLIVQLIEVNGIRANAYGHVNDPFAEMVMSTIKSSFVVQFNIGVVFFAALTFLSAKILDYKSGQHSIFHIGKRQIVILLATILSFLYLILLSSKVKPENMQKGEVIFSYTFFILLLLILSVGYLCSRIKVLRYFLPLLILLVTFNIRNVRSAFLGVQCLWGTSEYECIAYDRNFIDQVRHSEALGQDSVTILVPKFDLKDNWPLAFDSSEGICVTLSKHSVIKRYIKSDFKLQE